MGTVVKILTGIMQKFGKANHIRYFKPKVTTAVESLDNKKEENNAIEPKSFEEIPHYPFLPLIGSSWTYMPLIGIFDPEQQQANNKKKAHTLGPVCRDNFYGFNIVTSFRAEDMQVLQSMEGPQPVRCPFQTLQAYRENRKEVYPTPGLLVVQGAEWRNLRRKTQKHWLDNSKLTQYSDLVECVSKEFVEHIRKHRDMIGEVKNFLEELYKWSLTSVSLVALDTKLNLFNNQSPDGKQLIEAIQTQFKCINKMESFNGMPQLWKMMSTPTYKKFTEASDIFTKIAFKFIDDAAKKLENNNGSKTILQTLLTEKDLKFTDLRVVMADMILGSIDTSSHSVAFLLYHLAKHPDKQQILFEETEKALKNKTSVTLGDLKEIRYLNACMKESRRMQPVFTSVARILHEEVVIGGYKVPPGTLIAINIQEITSNEKYFKNPTTFLPERWLKENGKQPYGYAAAQFGTGPRACMGRRFAEFEIMSLVSEIIRSFEVRTRGEIEIVSRIANMPSKNFNLQFIERH